MYEFIDKIGENMFGILDIVSIATIVGSFTLVIYNIRAEMKLKN